MQRLVVATACVMSLGATCGPAGGPPPPDRCSSGTGMSFGSVEMGPEIIADHPFQPWASDDTAYVTTGFQGGHMIGYSLRFPGDAAACIKQKTTVKQGGTVIAQEDANLNTYDAGDGTRTTHTNWLVFADEGPPLDSSVVVTTTTGGMTLSSTLTIEPDRHRLQSLEVLPPAPVVGGQITLQLHSTIAPEYQSFMPTVTYTNPSVLSIDTSSLYIYTESQTFQAYVYVPGETDVTLHLRDQAVTAHVVVPQ